MSKITLRSIAMNMALSREEAEFVFAIKKELEQLRAQETCTMIECANPACKRGVRPRYAIHGLCNECAREEMTRLKRVETAVLWGQGPQYAIEEWREQAAQFRDDGMVGWAQCCGAVADALEASK